jgi:HK97 family phage portal protein
MTAADMQFLESRKFTVLEICRFFGVHPSFVFGDTATNYKSAEMANVAFLSNTLAPILRQIELEIARKLLPIGSSERIRFDREELYATDLESRMAYIEKRIQTGTLTPNEARTAMGMQPIEGGDVMMISANLKPITEITDNNGKE